ncbi:hypothetical protein [Streptomyces sp. NPDC001020]
MPRPETPLLAGGSTVALLVVDLPLTLLGVALVPLLTWALTSRWVGRPWVAVLTALAALSLGVWGLLEWWTPRHPPDFGDGHSI